MNLSLNELTKMATQEVNFDETFFSNIEECIKYNSIGTLNWAIHTLTIIRERIDVGQKVKYKDIDLTSDTYKELLHEHYGIYVVKGVYPKMALKHKVFQTGEYGKWYGSHLYGTRREQIVPLDC